MKTKISVIFLLGIILGSVAFLNVGMVKADYPAVLVPVSVSGSTATGNVDISMYAKNGNQMCLKGSVGNRTPEVGCVTFSGVTTSGSTVSGNVDISMYAKNGNQICLKGSIGNRTPEIGCITLSGATTSGSTAVGNVDISMYAKNGNQICLKGTVGNRTPELGCVTITSTTYSCPSGGTLSGTTCVQAQASCSTATAPNRFGQYGHNASVKDIPNGVTFAHSWATGTNYEDLEYGCQNGSWVLGYNDAGPNTIMPCFDDWNGETVYCFPPINGSCGSSDSQSFFLAPTNNLCSSGTAMTVSGSGPWSWSCFGTNGGSTASCNANLAAGSCGISNGQYFFTTPTADLCASGSATAVSGVGPWNWSCNGTACSANIKYTCTNVDSLTYAYAGATFESSDAACSSPIGTITYTAKCSNIPRTQPPVYYPGLDISACQAPVVSVQDSTSQIAAGGSSTFSWSTSNASTCYGTSSNTNNDGSWTTAGDGDLAGDVKNLTGSQVLNPQNTTTYTLECWNSAGLSSGQQSLTVTVLPAPSGTLSANSGSNLIMLDAANGNFGSGKQVTLNWDIQNATTCKKSWGDGSIVTLPSGSETITQTTQSATYSLVCDNSTVILGETIATGMAVTTACRNYTCGSGVCNNSVLSFGVSDVSQCKQECTFDNDCKARSTSSWREVAP